LNEQRTFLRIGDQLKIFSVVVTNGWEKPALGRYKCNVDASFSSYMNMIGIKMCILDDAGDFVLAKYLGSLIFVMLT